jgi:hypothetical protein
MAHLLRQPGPVPVAVAAHVAFIFNDAHDASVMPRDDATVNLVP